MAAARISRLFIRLVLIVLFTIIGHGCAAGFLFCPTGGPEVWHALKLSLHLLCLTACRDLITNLFLFISCCIVRQPLDRINESK